MARFYSNTSRNMTLAVGVGTSDVTITVDDASGLPVSFPYLLAIDPDTTSVEVVRVDSAASNTLTVVRGQQDTPAKTHSTGAVVIHAWTALDGQEAQDHFAASQNVHGIGGSANVVGTTTAQTLTNKTINGSNNTLSNIPGSAITGAITTGTIAVANVTGDWPIDTRSTGSIPVDTRTTGNLPGSRLASPVTNAMAFSSTATFNGSVTNDAAVTMNQTNSGEALVVVNHASAAAATARIVGHQNHPALTLRRNNSTTTGTLLACQTEGGTDLVTVLRDGRLIAVAAIAGDDFLLPGSRSVEGELDLVRIRAIASRNTTQAITSGTEADVTLTTEVEDNGNLFTASSVLMTVPASHGGTWRVSAWVVWEPGATGFRRAAISRNNGTTIGTDFWHVVQLNNGAGADVAQCITVDLVLAATDTIRIKVLHNQGANLNVNNARLSMQRTA